MPVFLKKVKKILPVSIQLPSSKSESNRALVINALAGSQTGIENLSQARDTQTMIRLLNSDSKLLDVLDAGTTMRFLLAYFSIKNINKILTGTERMQERPVGILVEALRSLGVSIRYLNKEGFPPVEILGFQHQEKDQISIPGNISSQFISALLMVAPLLPEGLTLELTGKIASRPYIEMTLAIMEHYGVAHEFNRNQVKILPQVYTSKPFRVSPDWSAASYWYSLVALAEEAEIRLPGLLPSSYQGDKVIVEIMDKMGVATIFESNGIHLRKKDHTPEFRWDFSNCPDLAQTAVVTAAAKGITLTLTGIESLRIKETDRILALQKELNKFHAGLMEINPGEWSVIPVKEGYFPESCQFESYGDHRMAMALAPLVMVTNVNINDHRVVTKSYPGFWNDLAVAGIDVTIVE